jgi:type II secretory pathway pseudopilin PulG
VREYYRGTSNSDLVNFENAIKKINEALAGIAQNGETDWIGKFSGVLVLVNGADIHFAQTGTSNAYLYRAGRVNHITEGLQSSDTPHPLKTFTNLTSGTLEEGDKVVVANELFFSNIAPNELKIIAGENSPTTAAVESAQILKGRGIKEATAIFIESTTKQKLASLDPSEKVETIYIDQAHFSLRPNFKKITDSLRPILFSSGKALSDMYAKSSEKVTDFSSKQIENLKNKSQSISKAPSGATKTSTEDRPDKLTRKENESFKKIKNSLKKYLLKTKNKLRRIVIQTGLYSRKKSKRIMIGLIIFSVLLVATVSYSVIANSKTRANQKTQSTIQAVTDTYKKAQGTTDKQAAADQYKNVLSLIDSLPEKSRGQFADITTNVKAKINELKEIKSVNEKKALQVETGSSLTKQNDGSYLIVSPGGKTSVLSQTFETSQGESIEGANSKIIDSVLVSDEGEIITQGQDGSLGIFDPSKTLFSKISDSTKTENRIKSFASSFYFLDKTQSQIMKIVVDALQASTAKAYLKDNIDLTNVTDVAIDGSVYTIDKSGDVVRYSRGTKIETFTIKLPLESASSCFDKLETSADSSNLFATCKLDNSLRVVLAKKNGNFVGQFLLNGINSDSYIKIDPDQKLAFVIQANQLKIFDLKL